MSKELAVLILVGAAVFFLVSMGANALVDAYFTFFMAWGCE